MITWIPSNPSFYERILSMDFQKSYYASVKSNHIINLELTADFLIPNIYCYSFQDSETESIYMEFMHLLGGGNIHTDFPISFSFRPLKCCLIIYTEKGGGKVTVSGSTLSITEGTVAFIDGDTAFALHSFILPWKFKLFFIDGRDLRLYRSLLPGFGKVYKIPEYSFVKNCFYSLLSIPVSTDIFGILLMHKNLSEILSTLFLSAKTTTFPDTKNIPGYLTELHDLLENQYAQSFSLEKCEALFRVNRYRLCREFSETYGLPPVKYLIRRRLDMAKKMLLTTDLTIHEISSKVGYDNVNHFINLFKKDTGLTPGMFRQKVLADQPALRSPSR